MGSVLPTILRSPSEGCQLEGQPYRVNGFHCNSYTDCYIDQLGPTFFTRFKEHTTIYNKEAGDESLPSSFANHFLNTDHECDISNLSVLHIEQDRVMAV